MKLRITLLASSMLVITALAHSQPVNGLYVGGGLGYNILDKVSPNTNAFGF